MEAEFTTDWAGFKQMVKEFLDRCKKGAAPAQIEGGLKAIGLAYIYMTGDELEKHQSMILLTIVHREAEKYLEPAY